MLSVVGKNIIELKVNGNTYSIACRPADTLLDTLREQLGLTGAKVSCRNGACGACTVLVNGWPIKACLMLTVEAIGQQITTVEGLQNTPIQQAFIQHFATQCGYCTPGMVVTAHALINKHPEADDGLIVEWLEANLCRCTGYEEIKTAIKSALNSSQL